MKFSSRSCRLSSRCPSARKDQGRQRRCRDARAMLGLTALTRPRSERTPDPRLIQASIQRPPVATFGS